MRPRVHTGAILTLGWLAGVARGQMCCTNCVNACRNSGRSSGECQLTFCASYCSTTACYAGQYKPDPACTCTNCPLGKYSASFTPDGGCTDCPSGMYISITGSFACAFCPAGQQQPSTGQSSCLNCDAGKYKPNLGLSACTSCAAGTFQSNTGQSSCYACTTNPRCPAGTIKSSCTVSSDTVCVACTSPFTTQQVDQTACNQCVAGYYNNGASTGPANCISCASPAITCGSGQYIRCPAYSTSFQCVYCTGTGMGGTGFCGIGQQPNNYCASGTDRQDDTCVFCPAGTEKNSASIQSCTKCNTGFYKTNTGMESCGACPSRGSNYAFVSWGSNPATNPWCPW